jgi:hypothetical protein
VYFCSRLHQNALVLQWLERSPEISHSKLHFSLFRVGILIETTALIHIFPCSLSFCISTRVGNELGANQPKKAKLAATVGISFSFMLRFSALLFVVMVRKIWATMFTQDAEIITLTSLVLPPLSDSASLETTHKQPAAAF